MKKENELHPLRTVVALLTLLLWATSAQAINMTIGDVVVQNLGSYGFTSTNSVFSTDSGATDQIYQMYGYLGNANGVVSVQGASFNVLTGISATGNVATSSVILDANGAAALGLAAGDIQIDYTFTLVDDTSPADHDGLLWDLTMTNLSGAAQDLTYYAYLDLDLGGAADFADDEATGSTSQIVVTDANDGLSFAWSASGGSADHFQIGGYPSVRNTLNGMTSATNLSDATAVFGPGDFTGAFQYIFANLANGASVVISNPIPEPGVASLLLFGLSILSIYGHKNKKHR